MHKRQERGEEIAVAYRDNTMERFGTMESGPDASRVIAYRRVFRAVPVTWQSPVSLLLPTSRGFLRRQEAVGMSTVIGRDMGKGKW